MGMKHSLNDAPSTLEGMVKFCDTVANIHLTQGGGSFFVGEALLHAWILAPIALLIHHRAAFWIDLLMF